MGFFSWKTSDTNESVSNSFSVLGALPCKMITPHNEYIELKYEGYGVFGGKDYYELVYELNNLKGKDKRSVGIDFDFYDERTQNKILPKLVSLDCKKKYEELPNSERCEFQGYFYP